MNPILLARQVVQGLEGLVHDSFATTTPAFAGSVTNFLAKPGNFIKGPWVSLAMPFRPAENAAPGGPFPHVPLPYAPYRHQELAFNRLSGENAGSTLIATGTGSGKTESYLWPALEHCRANMGKPGIKVILIYPMNALATDQARRIAHAIATIPALKGLRAGIYADSEPASPTDAMTPTEVITRREVMRQNPPDILLTNYKMLDYLLVRPRDRALWQQNTPESLRFLVVDEMHTFDGAQGADLALLIRRLKARLKTPAGHLLCVGSSATMGSGDEAKLALCDYGQKIFGEDFPPEAVVTEDRKTADEVLPEPEYFHWPTAQAVNAALREGQTQDQAEVARRFAEVLFPDALDPDLGLLHSDDPTSTIWRTTLGKVLKEQVAVQRVIKLIAASKAPSDLEEIALDLTGVKALSGRSLEECRELAELIVSLISWARESGSLPLFGVRLQIWAREMARIVAGQPVYDAEGNFSQGAEIWHADDLEPHQHDQMLPVISCARCGAAAHLGRQPEAGKRIWAGREELYADFFDSSSKRLRLFWHEPVLRKSSAASAGNAVAGLLDTVSMEWETAEPSQLRAKGTKIPVWMQDPHNDQGKVDRTCPACGHAQALLLFGLRAARMTSALANTLYASQHNELNADEKPRLLLFSDSVQDAAHRAAVTEIRNSGAVVRKALYQAITGADTRGISLSEIIEGLPAQLMADKGPESFVATFVARQHTWREAYKELISTGKLPDNAAFLNQVKLRLGWEFFSELTYRSHTAQTLEMGGLALADVEPELLRNAAHKLANRLPTEVHADLQAISPVCLAQFLGGFLQQMRRKGAVAHRYVHGATLKAARKNGELNWFAGAATLGQQGQDTLPVPDSRKGPAPRPISLHGNVAGCDALSRRSALNWYKDWISRNFEDASLRANAWLDSIWEVTLRVLEEEDILRKVDREGGGGSSWIITPAAITVSADVLHFACTSCSRTEKIAGNAAWATGAPCTRISCQGRLEPSSPKVSAHLSEIMATDRLHRVVAREHTGMLEADNRLKIENGFIKDNSAWAPNLISATPTLEMGIDIGALSTLLLCSVPPEEANYVQRIGRTGRRDGNSLNLVFANARSHDLQFWENPMAMISGNIRAPGVYLDAIAILRRQMAAFTLDCFVADGEGPAEYGKMRPLLTAIAKDQQSAFPLTWFAYVRSHAETLAQRFLALLPPATAQLAEVRNAVELFLVKRTFGSLPDAVRRVIDDIADEREGFQRQKKDNDKARKTLLEEQAQYDQDAFEKRKSELEDEARIIQRLIKDIDDAQVLQQLTDRGILPNYAFPEEGVKLKSLILPERSKENPDRGELPSREYTRPASQALSEFALGQHFYAEGRDIAIERLDLSEKDLLHWRFCPDCSHTSSDLVAQGQARCPKCKSEMWADKGALHTTVVLKNVIAVTAEAKAVIQDSDDRTRRHHDRLLVPDYEDSMVKHAWVTGPEAAGAPFGFEFVSQCEFRDFNFGERDPMVEGAKIAGQPRKSRPFHVCQHCGHLQSGFPREEVDPKQHRSSCPVVRSAVPIPREKWNRGIFLMRHFRTETIRIVMPVIGEPDYDLIKSFVAGINLGLREHFSGKVDHIRSAVAEVHIKEGLPVRSLYLYDSVPGGSGYLRQLAEPASAEHSKPDAMYDVVQAAVKVLENCPCASQGRSGCHRCVKSWRNQFGPGEPDRGEALRMMQEVLEKWPHLKQAEGNINASITDGLVESKLEKAFIERVSQEFGESALIEHVLTNGRRGFILNTSADPHSARWEIEPQVQIDQRWPGIGLPKKRVDFVFSPIGKANSLPMIVELDGVSYHAKSLDKDLSDRLAMMRSGKLRVWSLLADDLHDDAMVSLPNPTSSAALGPQHAGALAKVLQQPALQRLAATVTALAEGSSLDLFFTKLRNPELPWTEAAALLTRIIIKQGAQAASLTGYDSLSVDSTSHLLPVPVAAKSSASTRVGLRMVNLDLWLGADQLRPSQWPGNADPIRLLAKSELPLMGEDDTPAEGWSDALRGLWRLMNLFQPLHFHVEIPGVEGLIAPKIMAGMPDSPEWRQTFEDCSESYHPLLRAIKGAELPAPQIGLDIIDQGKVSGMAELAWPDRRLAVNFESFPSDWTILQWDPEGSDDPLTFQTLINQLTAHFVGEDA